MGRYPERDMQQLAGHSSLATIQRYIEGSSDAKRAVIEALGKRRVTGIPRGPACANQVFQVGAAMATVKKGILVRSPEWWKHLRKRRAHRRFWKA